MKTKECIKQTLRLVEIGIKKATSYNAVKGKLGNRLYNDEFLQARIAEEKKEKAENFT